MSESSPSPGATPTPTPIPVRPNDLIVLALDTLVNQANAENHVWTDAEINSYNIARGYILNHDTITGTTDL